MTAFLIQLGLHGLTGIFAFLLGLATGLVDSREAGLFAAVVLPLAVAAMAASGAWIEVGRRRARGREAQARRTAEARVDHLARHDALTGLANRDAFLDRLHAALGGGRRSDRMAAVLCVDLADFKAINDTLGRVAGDILLRHTSSRLLATLRESDLLARMGADEFAILQNGIDGPAGAADLCERLLAAMAEPFELCGHLTHVGTRIGVAVFPGDAAEAELLLQYAGLALGRAKTEPPGTFRFFEDAMDTELRERKALEQDLVHALERSELELEYQPQFDIASRRMVGVEALLRWQHPEHGRIGPDRFIPLAEDSGLIVPIGRWVLEQACLQAVAWHQLGALRCCGWRSTFRRCSSGIPNLAEPAGEILRRSGLAADQLELEITERVLMEDTEANLRTLASIEGPGHPDLDRRLRRRPFVAELPAPLPVRRDQARPLFRRCPRSRSERGGDRARHAQPQPQPRPGTRSPRASRAPSSCACSTSRAAAWPRATISARRSTRVRSMAWWRPWRHRPWSKRSRDHGRNRLILITSEVGRSSRL